MSQRTTTAHGGFSNALTRTADGIAELLDELEAKVFASSSPQVREALGMPHLADEVC